MSAWWVCPWLHGVCVSLHGGCAHGCVHVCMVGVCKSAWCVQVCMVGVCKSAWWVCLCLHGGCVQVCMVGVSMSAWWVCASLHGGCVQVCMVGVSMSAWWVCPCHCKINHSTITHHYAVLYGLTILYHSYHGELSELSLTPWLLQQQLWFKYIQSQLALPPALVC